MRKTTARLFGMGLVVLGAGCAVAAGGDAPGERVGVVSEGQIIGTNDFVVVTNDGANIPAKYRPIIDAFGAMSVGCTATHVGNGIAVTAGHCFSLSSRVNNRSCSGTVAWGLRADKAAYLTSSCTTILAGEVQGDRDWAIFRVSPTPPVSVQVDLGARKAQGTPLTIFGHPQLRPLEWSNTCVMLPSGGPSFNHECDTEPGNSGSSILDDTTLKVVGIHDGATGSQNYGTHLADTPIAQFVAASDAGSTDAGGGDAGGQDGGTDAGEPDAGTDAGEPDAGGACAPEGEPNDSYTSPNPIDGAVCGRLSAGDVDWYGWSVGATPVPYDIALAAAGDAELRMWKLVDGSWYQVANTTSTRFTKTSNGAGSYVISVRSPSSAAQTYTLTLTR